MITQVRYSQWETNSSSVHQLIIRMKDPELEIPDKLIFRNEDVYLGRENLKTPQDRLDFVVQCVISDYVENKVGLYCANKLLLQLEVMKIEVEKDWQSFHENDTYPGMAADIAIEIATLLKGDDFEPIKNFIFSPHSSVECADNNHRYDAINFINPDHPDYLKYSLMIAED